MKVIKSKDEIKKEVFRYIESRSEDGSDVDLLELTEESIINHIKRKYRNSEKQIKDVIEELENDNEIKLITIEKDIYIYKGSKEFEKKLKGMGILPFMPKIRVLISSLILASVLLFYISFISLGNLGAFFELVYLLMLFSAVFYYILSYVPDFLIKKLTFFKNKNYISYILIVLSIVLAVATYFFRENAVFPLMAEILFGLATMIYKK